MSLLSLSYFLFSLFLVGFGQPAWIPLNGLIAAVVGFAFFWRILLDIPSKKKRFFLSMLWFFGIQLIQLSWFLSHPYAYIYGVYLFLALICAVQFGLIGLFITEKNLSILNLLGIASLWTLFEWSRLYYLSGLSWNPSGLSLAGSIYALQAASIGGVFALSFWVFFTNLLALRCWIEWEKHGAGKWSYSTLWALAALAPYFYGAIQLNKHQAAEGTDTLSVLLVQPAFPVEEVASSASFNQLVGVVTEEWEQLLHLLKKQQHASLDLIVMPEYVVPLGTYNFVYPLQTVLKHFARQFGAESLMHLPPLTLPYCATQNSPSGIQLLVNNAYWAQGIANLFQADLLIGLEDAGLGEERECYSAALLFHPFSYEQFPDRYEKRVLVPLGEYIPFEFCAQLAARYGVFSSFTPGKEAKVLRNSKGVLLSPSICYEETFGHLIREGRQKGAGLLANLSSDVWYPNSKLPRQHLEHARLRTVENGIPLIRSCNTGITAAIDSLGRDVALLGGEHPERVEWVADILPVKLPLYAYHTLYSIVGDTLIVGISLFFSTLLVFQLIKKRL
jgi:apolipoprotein N-acyltransferase